MPNGLMIFCQHAYPASLKGACGNNNSEILKTFIQTGKPPKNIKEILNDFPNAIKNLKILSRTSGIKNIFDYRLVEAFWLGNNLLEKFPKNQRPFHLTSLLKDLKPALKKGSRPAAAILENCRISYGQVLSITSPISQKHRIGQARIIEYNPIGCRKKTLAFLKDKIKTVEFIDPHLKKNDLVSLHHNHICGSISEKQLIQLAGYTILQLFF